MQGVFKAMALGKSSEKSKNGKYHYLFVNGNREKGGLFTDFSVIEFWSEVDVPVIFGQVYSLILDINGDYVKFIEFVNS